MEKNVKNSKPQFKHPYEGHEYESVRYRHEDQSKLSQVMSLMDLQLFSGFMTIQLAFGSFLLQQSIDSTYLKIGILFIDFSISLLCFVLLRNNYRRRKEVVQTIKNCNEALGYNQNGVYLPDKSINESTNFRPWFHWYTVGIVMSFIGIMVIANKPATNSLPSEVNQEILAK